MLFKLRRRDRAQRAAAAPGCIPLHTPHTQTAAGFPTLLAICNASDCLHNTAVLPLPLLLGAPPLLHALIRRCLCLPPARLPALQEVVRNYQVVAKMSCRENQTTLKYQALVSVPLNGAEEPQVGAGARLGRACGAGQGPCGTGHCASGAPRGRFTLRTVLAAGGRSLAAAGVTLGAAMPCAVPHTLWS